jgi:hypothetical protein
MNGRRTDSSAVNRQQPQRPDRPRPCLWCGALFTPAAPLSGVNTEHFCSGQCALASYRARRREREQLNRSAATVPNIE